MPNPMRALRRADLALNRWLYRLSIYGVPALLAVVTLAALLYWPNHYDTSGARPLDIRLLHDPSAAIAAPEARDVLRPQSQTVRFADTHLSEAPFWILVQLPAATDDETRAIEFPSRHLHEANCWQAETLTLIGSTKDNAFSGALERASAGVAFRRLPATSNDEFLCRMLYKGPARISANAWSEAQLSDAIENFHRSAGLLDGGLIVLAVFVLMIAGINRQWLYVLFAAWLVASLRLGALSAGWDGQWLGKTIPVTWLPMMRQVTIAISYVLTYTLFVRLFRVELRAITAGRPLRVAMWCCIAMLIASVSLSFQQFLPLMWALVGFGTALLLYYLIRIIFVTRSRVAVFYAASLMVTLFANLSEVTAAAMSIPGLADSINSVTAALTSSLLAALAIAEQMRQEKERRMRAQADLRSTYDAMPVGLFSLDDDGYVRQGNPALRAMFGWSRKERRHWRDHFGVDGWKRLQRLVIEGASAQEIQLPVARAGHAQPAWYLIKATRAQNRIEGFVQDITERVAATERLRFLADHDPLTGILNRRGIERVYETLSTAGESFALAYLDLDRFKLINDLFGHVAGDEVLKQVCSRAHGLLRDGHQMGRVGGDEFVVLFAGVPLAAAAELCRQLIKVIEDAAYRIDDRAFQLRCSIGVVEISPKTTSTDAISLADRACLQAKRGQHGEVVVFDKDAAVLGERAEERQLLRKFEADTAPDGLFLLMQPIIALADPYNSLNFEVLLRLRNEGERTVGAVKLIGAAERSGRISVIDRWVLTQVLQWLEAHHDRLPNTKFACMNLSGGSLNDERFTQDAFAILASHPKAAARLCIEITESVALHDLNNTRRFIDGARSRGARIALDDFGAGYTSFSYLKELPADLLKIDGEFVRGVASHPTDLSIIETIVQLARNLGMRSLAEWAEDRTTMAALASVGVDYVQGFAVAHPLTPETLLTGTSAASFITDPAVEKFVREDLAQANRTGLSYLMTMAQQDQLH